MTSFEIPGPNSPKRSENHLWNLLGLSCWVQLIYFETRGPVSLPRDNAKKTEPPQKTCYRLHLSFSPLPMSWQPINNPVRARNTRFHQSPWVLAWWSKLSYYVHTIDDRRNPKHYYYQYNFVQSWWKTRKSALNFPELSTDPRNLLTILVDPGWDIFENPVGWKFTMCVRLRATTPHHKWRRLLS